MEQIKQWYEVPEWKDQATFQGDILRGLRIGRGVSQGELSQAMGVSRRTIINWEQSQVMPSDRHLYKLALAFHAPVTCFLRHKDWAHGLGRVPR